MRKTASFLLIAFVALAAVSVAEADRQISETREIAPDGTVSIELIAGTVRFIGWSRAEVEVTGTIGDDVDEVEIDASRRGVEIEVHLVEGRRHIRDGHARLEIHVPVGSQIEAETVSADIEIEGIEGAVEIESVSGDVEINSPVREAEVATVSGTVRVTSSSPLEGGSFETVSGKVVYEAPIYDGRFSFSAVSGDLILRLPSDSSVEFEMETFSGDIENDFGPRARKTSEYLPAKTLEFSMGSGDARVSVESFSGTIKLSER